MLSVQFKSLGVVCALFFGIPVFAGDPAGLPNFHKVNEHLFRGAQPSAQGFKYLAGMGVKTVVDLREEGKRSLEEKKVVETMGMRYISVPMRGMHTPSEEQINKVLGIFNDESAGPVFVHCRRGADRTGTVVACYRISHDHWDNSRALQEAKNLGMAWIQVPLERYVMGYHSNQTASAPASATPAPATIAAPLPATGN
jgi:tyrosine-protein phosphatase SIW14